VAIGQLGDDGDCGTALGATKEYLGFLRRACYLVKSRPTMSYPDGSAPTPTPTLGKFLTTLFFSPVVLCSESLM
jgi:hypothetical protein